MVLCNWATAAPVVCAPFFFNLLNSCYKYGPQFADQLYANATMEFIKDKLCQLAIEFVVLKKKISSEILTERYDER